MRILKRLQMTSGLVCGLGAVVVPAGAAWAQAAEQDGTVMLKPVTVTGTREAATGPVSGYVARESSTASKTGASILETPQSVSVVGRQEMEDRNVQSTTEALHYTPGVFASTSAVSRRFDYVNIRGFDVTNTGALLDGLRSTTRQSYVRYQPYGMERVEVLRGPSSVLYGANSLGGVVNAVSKRPTEEARHEVGMQFGSFDRLQGQVDFSGPLTEDKRFLYRLVGVGRSSDTQFDHVEDDTTYIAPSITWRPDDATSLTVLTSFTRDEIGPPRPFVPIQGTLQSNPNGSLPDNLYLDGSGLDNHNEQLNLSYDFDHRFDDRWSISSTARYTRNDLHTETLSGMSLAADMRTLNRSAYQFGITGTTIATDNSVSADWETDVLKATSVAGLSYRHTDEDYYLNAGSAPSIDIYNPVHKAAFSAPTPFTKTDQEGDELGLYTAQTLRVMDTVVVDLAGRQDWAWVDTDNLLTGSTTSQDDNDFTYRAGLTYLGPYGIAPYASYATSFEPVLGTNFYGEAFDPTTGKQVEAGVKVAPDGIDGLFTAAWFHLVQENVQTTDPDNTLNTIQTGEVTSQGVELSASVNLTPDVNLLASYTYTDLEVTETTDPAARGKRPTGQPEHMASLWGNYDISSGALSGLGLGAGVRYVGATYADSANTIRVPDVTLVDAAIRYDVGQAVPSLDGMHLAVNATNLFDKNYYTGCSTRSCSEGYDRSVITTLSYRW